MFGYEKVSFTGTHFQPTNNIDAGGGNQLPNNIFIIPPADGAPIIHAREISEQ